MQMQHEKQTKIVLITFQDINQFSCTSKSFSNLQTQRD